jgi:hypothetical protein
MPRIKNKLFLNLIILFIAIIPAFFALTKPGYWNMHDDMQMIRQLEMEKCFKDGQIPCRWTPDLGYEYGYPLFNFYPPMPYLVGQIYRTLGFSYVNTVKMTAITQIVLSALFMYLLASSIFGNIGGILASLFYTYVPYHALNVYVRGAMNEAWAAVFFPLILYFSRKLILEKKYINILGLSASFAGLMLSHNPMVLVFTPILFVWCLFWILTGYNKKHSFFKNFQNQSKTLLNLVLSGVFALGLSAFFTIPAVFESKYTQIDSMFTGYYNYSVHFTTLKQLFISNFWSDGPSVWGPDDGMSFMIGYLHWIIPVLIFLFIIFIYFKKHKISQNSLLSLILIIMGLFTVFMTHNKSTFIWQLFTPIQKIQFPWRILNLTALLFSLSVGIVPYIFDKYINKKITKKIIIFLSIVLVFLNYRYFIPVVSGPITDEQKFSGKAWTNQITSGIYDYLPITASTAAKKAPNPYIDQIIPEKSFVSISGQKKGSDWISFNLNLKDKSEIIISQLAFPNFKVFDNGNEIEYKIEPELGRILINLDTGDHFIYVKFSNTPLRSVVNYISLASWISLIIILTKPLWNRLIFKK